jgi:hypothetical protein
VAGALGAGVSLATGVAVAFAGAAGVGAGAVAVAAEGAGAFLSFAGTLGLSLPASTTRRSPPERVTRMAAAAALSTAVAGAGADGAEAREAGEAFPVAFPATVFVFPAEGPRAGTEAGVGAEAAAAGAENVL